jgi:hypothetical protein
MTLDKDYKWGSHLPVLMDIIGKTKGSVLELGTGLYSTPFLHWTCLDRKLVSYETDRDCYEMNKQYSMGNHEVKFINSWDEAKIEKYWDVVLIDHAPSQRRLVEIQRLAKWANYIIIHDTQRNRHFCDWDKAWPLFKYKKTLRGDFPWTTVVSNLKEI